MITVQAPADGREIGTVPDLDAEAVSNVVASVELRVAMSGPDFTIDVGPLVSSAQADIVSGHISDAVDHGANALVGGIRDGDLIEPTVLVNVDHSMARVRTGTALSILRRMSRGVPGFRCH